ncbi:MAG: NADH-quinone oxidoreductase subunit N [Euzebya sp.]
MTGVGYLAPEIIIVVGAMLTVLQAAFTSQRHQARVAFTALVMLTAAAVVSVLIQQTTAPTLTLHSTWVMDDITSIARLGVLAVAALTVLLSPQWLRSDQRHGEWYGVILFGTAGSLMMAGAADVMELLIGVLLSSVTTVVMVGYHRRSAASTEAGIKTFLVGSLANVLLLVGITLFYGLAGTTAYDQARGPLTTADPALVLIMVALIIVGLTFKIGAVPTHSWLPDAAQGAPAPAAAFVTVAPKIGATIGLFRLLSVLPVDGVPWPVLVAVVAAVTMTVGNLAAMWQDDVRRLLGWSSVSQAGYALMPLVVIGRDPQAASALVVFLLGYAAAQMGAFAVVVQLRGRTRLADYDGLATRHPWLAAVLVLSLLSLVGIPPTAGFAGKLLIFAVTLQGGFAWLAVVAVLNTVVSLFYYLRILAPVAFAPAPDRMPVLHRWAGVAVMLSAAATVILGIGVQAVLMVVSGAPPLPS